MSTGSGNKILLTIIGILLVANIGMLIFFLNRNHPCPPEAPKPPGFTENIKTKVGFTEAQMNEFEPMKKEHWARMRERFDQIKSAKEAFYFQVFDTTLSDSVIREKAELIGEQQEELDLQVFSYFSKVRAMCTPEQLPKFDSIIPDVVQRITDRRR